MTGAAKQMGAVAHGGRARGRPLLRTDFLPIALVLTLFGWTALWAEGLGVIHFLPTWVDGAIFFCGLFVIPLGIAKSRQPEAELAPAPAEGTRASRLRRALT
jgi:hypothetical protein